MYCTTRYLLQAVYGRPFDKLYAKKAYYDTSENLLCRLQCMQLCMQFQAFSNRL